MAHDEDREEALGLGFEIITEYLKAKEKALIHLAESDKIRNPGFSELADYFFGEDEEFLETLQPNAKDKELLEGKIDFNDVDAMYKVKTLDDGSSIYIIDYKADCFHRLLKVKDKAERIGSFMDGETYLEPKYVSMLKNYFKSMEIKSRGHMLKKDVGSGKQKTLF